MGTKNNPGKFDCYANAEPDEPMFILLGRDKHAPVLTRIWAELRQKEGEDPEKVAEAMKLATEMEKYRLVKRMTTGRMPSDKLNNVNSQFRSEIKGDRNSEVDDVICK